MLPLALRHAGELRFDSIDFTKRVCGCHGGTRVPQHVCFNETGVVEGDDNGAKHGLGLKRTLQERAKSSGDTTHSVAV